MEGFDSTICCFDQQISSAELTASKHTFLKCSAAILSFNILAFRSMPNAAEDQKTNQSGPDNTGTMPQHSASREDERSLLGPLGKEALRGRRASSAELQLPWTCPVTHSREKFYTVCSDYALLNQAASVYRPSGSSREALPPSQPDGRAPFGMSNSGDDYSKGQAGGEDGGVDGDCDMEEVSSDGNVKRILAWEIDTTDFDAVLTRKIGTSKQGL